MDGALRGPQLSAAAADMLETEEYDDADDDADAEGFFDNAGNLKSVLLSR